MSNGSIKTSLAKPNTLVLICDATALLSPPTLDAPHVTTEPSVRSAANALLVTNVLPFTIPSSTLTMVVTLIVPSSFSFTPRLSAPPLASPHVTTEPSSRNAAKALGFEKIAFTSICPSSAFETDELSPPLSTWPHVTTDPSARIAANALPFETILITSIRPSSFDATVLLSAPELTCPHVITEPSFRNAAKA